MRVDRWRMMAVVWAFLATALYVASFEHAGVEHTVRDLAVVVGAAAALSWPVFGALLTLSAGPSIRTRQWFDTCLSVIARGSVVLIVGAGLNLAWGAVLPAPALLILHGTVLVIANAVMATRFVALAAALGMSHGRAGWLWGVGLNVVFGVLVVVLQGVLS